MFLFLQAGFGPAEDGVFPGLGCAGNEPAAHGRKKNNSQ